MGCLGTIFKAVFYAFLILIILSFFAGIIYTRKFLMSPEEIEQVEERYRQDTSATKAEKKSKRSDEE